MKRREFVVRIGGGLLAVPALLKLTACGGGDDDGSDGGDGGGGADAATGGSSFMGMTSEDDNSFHDHTFTIQCSDLDNATLSVTASGSGHGHVFELDSTQLATLASGGTVEFTTNDSHPHAWIVTGSC